MKDLDGLEFAKAMDRAFAQLRESTFEEYTHRVEEIQKQFCEDVQGSPRYALEMQRRVAEGMCHAAVLARRSPSECQQLLARLDELGYTNVGQEFTIVSVMARYFLERGDTAASDRLVRDFTAKLDQLAMQVNAFKSQLRSMENMDVGSEDSG